MLFNVIKDTKEYKRNLFDFKKMTITVLAPLPMDAMDGLVLEETYLSVEHIGKNLISHKVGLNGEVLISENLNGVCTLTLKYLPNVSMVSALDWIKKSKMQFAVYISNNSSPKYKGVASECRIMEKPVVGIGTGGFRDYSYKILMSDYIDVYPTDRIKLQGIKF
jgi:hypothetical protein